MTKKQTIEELEKKGIKVWHPLSGALLGLTEIHARTGGAELIFVNEDKFLSWAEKINIEKHLEMSNNLYTFVS